MVQLKRTEMRVIEDAFRMRSGYVLNFSDRTFAEFFEDEFGIGIYDEKYAFNGSSKANRLRAFVEAEDAYTVWRVLRRLWNYRESLTVHSSPTGSSKDAKDASPPFFDLLSRIEVEGAIPRTDALEKFDVSTLFRTGNLVGF